MNQHIFIASEEDDEENYHDRRYEALSEGGPFVLVNDFGDRLIYENRTHQIVCDCGISELYKLNTP